MTELNCDGKNPSCSGISSRGQWAVIDIFFISPINFISSLSFSIEYPVPLRKVAPVIWNREHESFRLSVKEAVLCDSEGIQ